MKIMTFSLRTAKEILRDPLNVAFGLGFPLVLLFLLSAIQANVPVPLFEIAHLAPGIAVFSLAFLTLFSATLLSKDRESALLQRLYTAPMDTWDFIAGYALPVLPIALGQSLVCCLAAVALGLEVTINLLWAAALLLPVALFYIALGLLCGSLLGVKAVGGICGAGLTNLSAWLSGVWFDLSLVGGWFERAAYVLPFVHAVELERCALAGELQAALPHLGWVLGYTAAAAAGAVLAFRRQRRRQ